MRRASRRSRRAASTGRDSVSPFVDRTQIEYDCTRNEYELGEAKRASGPLERPVRQDSPPGARVAVRPPRGLVLPSSDRPADRLRPGGRAAGARPALPGRLAPPDAPGTPGLLPGESRCCCLPGASGPASEDRISRRHPARGAGAAGRPDPSGFRVWLGCTRGAARRQRRRSLRRRRRGFRHRGARPDPSAGTTGTGREPHGLSAGRVPREGRERPPLRDERPARGALVRDRRSE